MADQADVVIAADLAAVALSGGRIAVSPDQWTASRPPTLGDAVIVIDSGLSKPGLVVAVDAAGLILIDVVGARVRAHRAALPGR